GQFDRLPGVASQVTPDVAPLGVGGEPDNPVRDVDDDRGNGHRATGSGDTQTRTVGDTDLVGGGARQVGAGGAGGSGQERFTVLHAPGAEQLSPCGQDRLSGARLGDVDGPGHRCGSTFTLPLPELAEFPVGGVRVGQSQVDVHGIGDRGQYPQVGKDPGELERVAEGPDRKSVV